MAMRANKEQCLDIVRICKSVVSNYSAVQTDPDVAARVLGKFLDLASVYDLPSRDIIHDDYMGSRRDECLRKIVESNSDLVELLHKAVQSDAEAEVLNVLNYRACEHRAVSRC
jgi:hypothetical protein